MPETEVEEKYVIPNKSIVRLDRDKMRNDIKIGKGEKYVRILSHELMHLYYEKNHLPEVARWHVLRDYLERDNAMRESLCDKFSKNYKYGIECTRECSEGEGHERNNPEHEATCAEENSYK